MLEWCKRGTILNFNKKILIFQLECGKWLLPHVEGEGDVSVLTLHGVGTDRGVLPCCLLTKRGFPTLLHTFTSLLF